MKFEVLAEITVLDFVTSDFNPKIARGIRPIIRYEGMIGSSCAIDMGSRDEIFPGETLEVGLAFINPDMHKKLLSVGHKFGLYLASRKVADGTVLIVD
jgi:hypothetical protein